MLVVAASAIVDLLLVRSNAGGIGRHLADHSFDLHAPHLIDVEVVSALRRVVASGEASDARGRDAVADLLDLPIERYAHDALLPRVWQLRENLSAYDATYVALAEALADEPVPLLTADDRLARALPEHTHVPIVGVPE
jgi:predicted nucleic acid-binding protein